jgi:benzoyl-CoA reductase/2-hydroxyglutaryl-CoA dehydratase subunit BcrC/BadD/HgdB
MNQEILIDGLRKMAERAGLKLSEDELRRLLPGVNRSKKQAAELRELVAAADEPASTFDLTGEARK